MKPNLHLPLDWDDYDFHYDIRVCMWDNGNIKKVSLDEFEKRGENRITLEQIDLSRYKGMSTGRILKMLQLAQASCGCYFDGDYHYTIDELKLVLSTREHVPNKIEARKLRQQRALQTKGTRGKSKVRKEG